MDNFNARVRSLMTELQRACLGHDHGTVIVASLSLAAHLLKGGRPPLPSGVVALLDEIGSCNAAFIEIYSEDDPFSRES